MEYFLPVRQFEAQILAHAIAIREDNPARQVISVDDPHTRHPPS